MVPLTSTSLSQAAVRGIGIRYKPRSQDRQIPSKLVFTAIISGALILLSGCAGPKGRYKGLFAPTSIAYHPIDISKPSSFTFLADLKVNSKPYVKTSPTRPDSIVGPYSLGIYSTSLGWKTPEGERLTDSLNFITTLAPDSSIIARIHRDESQFAGKIRLSWIDGNGSHVTHVVEGWGGSAIYNCVLVGTPYDFTWMRYHKNQKAVQIKVEVLVPDTNLAKILKDPQLWIYRGGGK